MNVSDKLWYSDGNCTSTKRQVLCQYVLPLPSTPEPTSNPSDPCFYDTTNFTYFSGLANTKCYRVSSDKKQFAEAENLCLSDHPLFLHTPKLTSIETKEEEEKVRTIVPPVSDGMFWFGLKRDPTNSSNWYFINGDTYDSSYQNWRSGYPRDADGCDCVALVINDNSWVNTDCNKQLYSICAFRYN
ncbi:C-type lectin domain-containing protein [Caenorhabditis elegans]|nr:C-type lectin domain-containing protein [Caenorhabditis elegans]CTQ86953.1 C-type lectin domain-containing protein [Caenorhabditis elegans]|eukprot:NP_001300254.1 C-type LECtin [Caenorhabditis elegans]